MNEKIEKSKNHSHTPKNVVKDYVLTNIVFLVILLAVTIGGIFIALKPVTAVVHKAEAQASMKVRDVTVDASAEMSRYGDENIQYGNYIARVFCDEKGLNTAVYLGLNRVSARYGAGLAWNSDFFTADGKAVVAGYDETYLSALKYVEIGDVITVSTADGTVTYKVKDAFYESSQMSLDNTKCNLVIYSAFSDFSDNAGKCYYVFADKISGEGN